VIKQTFKDFELILINDGSTDGSDEKCVAWSKRDSRIIYVSKKNAGLGPTRNLGVAMAKYDYIAFLDSDDWWDERMLELTYATLRDTDADIVSCDFYYAHADDNGQLEKSELQKHWIFADSGAAIEIAENKDMLYKMRYSVWAKLFKKELFARCNVEQPAFHYEDSAVLHFMIAKSKIVSHVKEGLYYYRSNRNGRITSDFNFTKSMKNCLDMMLKTFIDDGIFTSHREELKRLSQDLVRMAVNQAESMRSQVSVKAYISVRDMLIAQFCGYFPECHGMEKRDFIILGSVNLRNIAKGLCWELRKAAKHYCFSSIISIFSDRRPIRLMHENPFRENWLNADFDKSFCHELENFDQNRYLLIDFLEERFDVGKCGNSYFTCSDAFEEAKEQLGSDFAFEKLSKATPAVFALWREKCNVFVDLLKKNVPQTQIVLFEMFLAEFHGEYGKEEYFEYIDDIQEINYFLEKCYAYFESKLPGVKIVRPVASRLYFSDKQFKFGCRPYHLNECAFADIADKTLRLLKEDMK
jgi:hypothetical protein